jgi:hypothetical protein
MARNNVSLLRTRGGGKMKEGRREGARRVVGGERKETNDRSRDIREI